MQRLDREEDRDQGRRREHHDGFDVHPGDAEALATEAEFCSRQWRSRELADPQHVIEGKTHRSRQSGTSALTFLVGRGRASAGDPP